MMTRMKVLFSGVLVTILLAVALPLQAKEGRGFRHHGQNHGKMGERLAEELNFTPEQREKLKTIQTEFKKSLPSKQEAMKAAHDDLEAALKGSASDDEIRKKFQTLQQKQNEFAQARFDKVLAIRALLTPEQKAKFKGFEGRGRGMMGKGMKGGHHHPPMDETEE